MKNPIWLRLILALVLAQALLIGQALFWPDQITAALPWAASPLNARLIASLYWMGAISVVLCMVARRYAEVWITLVQIGLLTGGLLLLTLPHLGEFSAETFPRRWLIFYTIDPLLIGLILWRLRGRDPAPAGRNAFAPLFIGYAAVLGIVGLILLALPMLAARLWPWALPPILGQVYSVFLLTFAVGGLLAAREAAWAGVRVYVLANLAMLLLIIIVSLYHSDRFKPGPPTWVWYSVCLIGALAFAAALLDRLRAGRAEIRDW
jgi:hypothetical protein